HGVDDSRAALARGGLLTVAGLGATVLASVLVSSRVASAFDARWRGGALTRVAVEGALLKPALSVRALLSAGRQVERALMDGDLERARQLLSWHLVSRNTTGLSASQVAGAAIASLAENVSDSVVAPLLAYRLGGMPAAYGYRFANTADAMLGYRTPELEWFGKPAARLDDLFNLAPSRATAVLIALVAGVARGSTRESLRVAWDDAGQTPSPNGGWPMAAMAGALGVRLEKRGVYVLGDHLREPRPSDIGRARKLVTVVTALATLAVDLS
ncbi:MAG: adenosylcobinamide-phosphate synthase CbiB, partial [bacterium]